MKNTRVFLSENFQFLVMKFSKYLNRRIFVMGVKGEVRGKRVRCADVIFIFLGIIELSLHDPL